MTELNYDPDSQILSIRLSKKKNVDSSIRQNCVIDYDSKGDIVNIDILDFNLEEILKNRK